MVEPDQGWKVHVADSLTGLEVAGLRGAGRIADIGAGAGFPGLPLAVALPAARVDLIESVGRKCAFIERAIEAAGIANATRRSTPARRSGRPRAEGREAYDAVTARAVGRLSTLAELASPLLREGGVLVAWKGRRDEDEEAQARARRAEAWRWTPSRFSTSAPTPAAATATCTCCARRARRRAIFRDVREWRRSAPAAEGARP